MKQLYSINTQKHKNPTLPLQGAGGYILIMLIFFACSKTTRLEQTLQFAGENRPELEKVLQHYRQDPADSLKYRAACFLIENMRYHYCRSSAQLDAFKVYIQKDEPSKQTLKNFEAEYGSLSRDEFVLTYDAQVITSDYLIRNIDYSFYLWEYTPWGKYLSFDDFCEELLPYRVGTEPIEDWKEIYHNKYQIMIDTAQFDKNDPIEACMIIFNYINNKTTEKLPEWVFADDLSSPNLGPLTLLNLRYGTCQEQMDMLCYVMRSIGVPTGIDIMVQHPNKHNTVHWWNYMRDTTGHCVAFDYYYKLDKTPKEKMSIELKLGVVYRKYYALQPESFPVKYNGKPIHVPETLLNPFAKNVSSLYFYENPVTLEVADNFKNGDVLYVCVFNNAYWVPITSEEVKDGKVTLRWLEPEILYQLASCTGDEKAYKAESYPFIPQKDGSVFLAKADENHKQDMRIARKFSLPWWWSGQFRYQDRFIGGRFQVANKPDFSDSVTLFTATEPAILGHTDLYPELKKPYRYARFIGTTESGNFMAELQFFSGDTQLKGEIIGTEGSYQNDPGTTKLSVFDGDISTFFAAWTEDPWVGLKFEKPEYITRIRYWFRNDDNNVFPGDEYEFLYWGEKDWVSLGKQVATDTILNYKQVPSKTIYWLRDRTKGKEERPFTYEDGEQVFW
ncbi:MAG: hypothetical protein LBU22_08190 [Dysgonamonadaceae bacterium]|jgi:hypothetical protein|nr:hypothetical protein [Dysgonamonadaceae bacterium]